MSRLNELIRLLDLPDADFWYDVASCWATDIIYSDTDEILSEVSDCWPKWPEERIEHLAYILGGADSEIERKLIYALQKCQYPSVVYRANEAALELKQN